MTKQDRLDALLAERDLESVWFARPNSFAWLTGASNVVDRETDVGVAAVGYDGDGLEVVTNNVEAERLRAEALGDVPVTAFEWYERSLAEAVADRAADRAAEPAAADFEVPGFESVDASPLRQPLTDADIEAYRDLGRETAEAVEAVCRELRPGDAESEVASALRVALSARGIEAPVALVGGADRARKYRHYTPTDAELGEYALVSVTAARGGLHASATRTVAFESEASAESLKRLRERHHATSILEVATLAATRRVASERETAGERETASERGTAGEGGTAGDVFDTIRDAYDRAGYPEEWRRHHQGGAAGYAGREWVATPDSSAAVTTPMAYAWNPTVRGAKSEDTVLVEDDGFEVLTDTGRWPTAVAEAGDAALELERPDVWVKSGD